MEASKFRKSSLLEGSRKNSFIVSQSSDDLAYDSDSFDRWKNMPLLGKMDSTLYCHHCHSQWSNSQHISNLSLYPPHKGNCTLNDCLAAFTMSEKVHEVYCPKCKVKRTVEKRLTLSKTPEILCIHFNRLSFGNQSARKINTKISFDRSLNITSVTNHTMAVKQDIDIELPPMFLGGTERTVPLLGRRSKPPSGRKKTLPKSNLDPTIVLLNGHSHNNENGVIHLNGNHSQNSGRSSPFSSDTSSLSSNVSDFSLALQRKSPFDYNDEENEYILTSVVVHLGDHSGGHYVCYRATNPTENNTSPWLYISDSSLRLVSFEEVKTQEAFMLFYQKKYF